MIQLTEEEDKSEALNSDLSKVIKFLCDNSCCIKFRRDLSLEIFKDGYDFDEIDFSDLFYPKNLLKKLNERIKNV